jgi:hypothetical protein
MKSLLTKQRYLLFGFGMFFYVFYSAWLNFAGEVNLIGFDSIVGASSLWSIQSILTRSDILLLTFVTTVLGLVGIGSTNRNWILKRETHYLFQFLLLVFLIGAKNVLFVPVVLGAKILADEWKKEDFGIGVTDWILAISLLAVLISDKMTLFGEIQVDGVSRVVLYAISIVFSLHSAIKVFLASRNFTHRHIERAFFDLMVLLICLGKLSAVDIAAYGVAFDFIALVFLALSLVQVMSWKKGAKNTFQRFVLLKVSLYLFFLFSTRSSGVTQLFIGDIFFLCSVNSLFFLNKKDHLAFKVVPFLLTLVFLGIPFVGLTSLETFFYKEMLLSKSLTLGLIVLLLNLSSNLYFIIFIKKKALERRDQKFDNKNIIFAVMLLTLNIGMLPMIQYISGVNFSYSENPWEIVAIVFFLLLKAFFVVYFLIIPAQFNKEVKGEGMPLLVLGKFRLKNDYGLEKRLFPIYYLFTACAKAISSAFVVFELGIRQLGTLFLELTVLAEGRGSYIFNKQLTYILLIFLFLILSLASGINLWA